MALPARLDFLANDDIGRPRLDWPEPLVLESIGAAYGLMTDTDGAIDAVRLHARFLHALVDGEAGRASRLRIELIACCSALQISLQTIAAADRAALSELAAIVDFRFRNSPRLRRWFDERLDDASARLAKRSEPTADAERPRHFRFASEPRRGQGMLAFAG